MTGGPDAVLVMGEALIDLVPSAEDPQAYVAQPRGAPANVAAGLALLGTPSWFAGALGGDGFARTIEQRLHCAGVDLGLCVRPGFRRRWRSPTRARTAPDTTSICRTRPPSGRRK